MSLEVTQPFNDRAEGSYFSWYDIRLIRTTEQVMPSKLFVWIYTYRFYTYIARSPHPTVKKLSVNGGGYYVLLSTDLKNCSQGPQYKSLSGFIYLFTYLTKQSKRSAMYLPVYFCFAVINFAVVNIN